MSVIQSASGRYISLTNPEDNQYSVQDIAHALANICRFAGHTQHFYSVAQHSVLVSLVEPDIMPAEKLFHDASEAFLGDITTPLKSLLPEYRAIESAMMNSIALWLGLPIGFHKFAPVKRADLHLLLAEKRDLMSVSCFDETVWDLTAVMKNCHEPIVPWSPSEAKQRFIERFFQIYPLTQNHTCEAKPHVAGALQGRSQ
ncbi:MAG: hypothetical protein HKM06_08630 [Spirochaetales bacterium]|nr:hypothetical protein [Spirochaetales bacterium]